MKRKKQMYIRNNIVFDPNIEEDFFDIGYELSMKNKKKYLKGKGKRKKYFGI
jgi:hypothetical protein